jgi:hypothetical protein
MAPHEVREIVDRLRAAYPLTPMSTETVDLYARMLDDLPYEEVDPIVDDLIATVMALPTVSRIRRAVIEPTLEYPTAEEAWNAVQTRTKDLHELVARAAVLLGGSFNIRTSDDPELTRVRFAKVYDGLRRKAVDDALSAGLRARRLRLVDSS